MDTYTQELQRHGLESVEREVRWLNELIDSERETGRPTPPKHRTTRPGTGGRAAGNRDQTATEMTKQLRSN